LNLFKVIASSKDAFRETQASTVLAWLLNPFMEHGLGFSFLGEFIKEIAERGSELESIRQELRGLEKNLRARLRSDDSRRPNVECYLEYNVESAFVDVLLVVNNWSLVIENKILPDSAQDMGQLVREYQGIQQSDELRGNRTLVIFIVPTTGGAVHPKCQAEYDSLKVVGADCKVVVSWQDHERMPSISRVLRRVLEAEREGRAEPIPEYARHTLKALWRFIEDGFSGYEFKRERPSGGMNPLTEARLSVEEIIEMPEGFVGAQHGIGGLLRYMMNEEFPSRTFQFTRAQVTSRNWLPLSRFKTLEKWYRADPSAADALDITAILGAPGKKQPLHSSIIHWLSTRRTSPFYVGIQGGEREVRKWSFEKIDQQAWQISDTEDTDQWIPAHVFRTIYEEARSAAN
jgi:hypothetical protein